MNEGRTRFSMVRARHKKTYEQALRQGKVDPQIKGICSFIAETKNFYTSSSCSGRIMLLEKKSDKKKDACFHRKWHRRVEKKDLREGLRGRFTGDLWFRVDPFILHIGTDSVENARKVLVSMREAGMKRGGIILAENGKVVLEIMGTDFMSIPVRKRGKKMLEAEHLEKILPEANRMLERNYERLEKFGKKLRKNME